MNLQDKKVHNMRLYAISELRRGRQPSAIIGNLVAKYKCHSNTARNRIAEAQDYLNAVIRAELESAIPENDKRAGIMATLDDLLVMPIDEELDALAIKTRLAVIKELNSMCGFYYKDYRTQTPEEPIIDEMDEDELA